MAWPAQWPYQWSCWKTSERAITYLSVFCWLGNGNGNGNGKGNGNGNGKGKGNGDGNGNGLAFAMALPIGLANWPCLGLAFPSPWPIRTLFTILRIGLACAMALPIAASCRQHRPASCQLPAAGNYQARPTAGDCSQLQKAANSFNGNRWQSLATAGNRCQPLAAAVNCCQPVTTVVNRRQPLSTAVDRYQPRSTAINRCQPLLTTVNR